MKYAKDGIGLSDVGSRLKAVLCGSFRRDPVALEREFHQLQEAGCTVLSPLDLDFVSEVEGFVFGQADRLRVFAGEPPENVAMRDLVQVCDSPAAAAELAGERADAPSRALGSLQGYYARAAHERGWDGETAAMTVGLLRGEVDELESALGEAAGADEDPALELADVLLYVVHIANILGLDLGNAVRDKERINSRRFDSVDERLAV